MRQLALPSYPFRFAHLAAVWAYAVSQPVFSMLQANPDFLVVRGSSRVEVVVFAVVLALAPPLLAVGSELAVRLASVRAADAIHLLCLGAFTAPLGLQLSKLGAVGRPLALVGTLAVVLASIALYWTFRAARLFLLFSLALPVVGLVAFVSRIPLAGATDVPAAQVEIGSRTPVVVIVFDELPLSSLLAADGRIDRTRFPNFARLARDATWYPRATTVHEHTTHALPAILDGQLPDPNLLLRLADHPRNLFTLLGESYDLRVVENMSPLCPRRYCATLGRGSFPQRLRSLFADVRIAYLHRVLPGSLTRSLPPIDDRWGGFGGRAYDDGGKEAVARDGRASLVNRGLKESTGYPKRDLAEFVSSIRRDEPARTLHFMHVILPHSPWRFLPSGREYGNAGTIDGSAQGSPDEWGSDAWLVHQEYQRHLLQVGFTDHALGQILRRLRATGLYDKALVVVTADHGVSFVAGGTRRAAILDNIAAIARVPLLIKYPEQRRGRIDTRPARSVDVLPTVADVLRAPLPWSVDGQSLLAAHVGSAESVVLTDDGSRVEVSTRDLDRRLNEDVRRKLALFGDSWDSLYAIGSNRYLIGRSLDRLVARREVSTRVHLDDEESLANVDLSSSFVPARITGRITGATISHETELAVAVNGRVVALTRSFSRDGELRFSALVPETSFRDGFNRVELFAVAVAGGRLVSLGSTGGRVPSQPTNGEASGTYGGG